MPKLAIRAILYLRVAGFLVFLQIQMMVRLGLVKVEECPAGLEFLAGDRNMTKSYCENTKKLATLDSVHDPNM